MAKSTNQKLKLIYIMDKFLRDTDENHGIKNSEIIEYLNGLDIKAERKTIYYDIELLKNYGLDIIMEKVGRECYYKLVSRDFELAELKLLVDSVQASKFITTNKSNELIKKLEGLASKHEARELQRQVYVYNRVKNPNERIYIAVDVIHRAIHNGVKVEYIYSNWDVNKKLVPKHDGCIYKISPWALTWNEGYYYMIGYDETKEKIKHFRVDKMINVVESKEPRTGKECFEKFDLPKYSKMTFGMYGGDEYLVKIRAKDYLAGVIIDRFGSDIMIHKDSEEGYFYVNVDIALSDMFVGWLVGIGNDIEVVSPAFVREKIKKQLTNILAKY